MRRILAILHRDLISTTRDAMLLYIVAAPVLLSLVIRLVMPAVGQSAVNVVIPRDAAAELAPVLEPYLHVEVAEDAAAVERRVLAFDETVGILPDAGGGYALVLEGNESHDARVLPRLVMERVRGGGDLAIGMVDAGGPRVIYRELVASFIAMGVLLFGSITMGFHVIEDKETRMMHALGVSPLTRKTYILARSLFGLGFSLLAVPISLLVFGVVGWNPLQVLAAILVGSLSAVLFGLAIGGLSSNQISGVANLKFGFLLMSLPAVASLFVPDHLQFALYWAPSYWAFVAFRAILVEGASWSALWPLLAAGLGVSLAALAALYPWFRRSIDLARA